MCYVLEIEMSATSPILTEKQNREIGEKFEQERKRLFGFIRKRVKTELDAEDILQDVFYQFISLYRNIEHIEKTSSWLFTVAKNKITDLYRKKKNVNFSELAVASDNDSPLNLEGIFTDFKGIPDDEYTKDLFWEALEEGLGELPLDQREVFVAHEFNGSSFKEISKKTGLGVNTLISKKRYAVLALREKLQELYTEVVSPF